MAVLHKDALAVIGLQTDDAAAEEVAVLHGHILAAVKEEHTAGAETGLGAVAESQVLDGDVGAAFKAEHIGVSGLGEDLAALHTAADSKARDTGDDQLIAVKGLLPVCL